MLYHVNHIMPELGSPTAGCSQTFDNLSAAVDEIRWIAASAMLPGHKLVLEIESNDSQERKAHSDE